MTAPPAQSPNLLDFKWSQQFVVLDAMNETTGWFLTR